MSIPGPLYKELHAALLGAFSRAELTMLVRTHLEAKFEALTADKNLTDQVDELLRWAERRGRLRELVEGAAAERPRNAALQAIQTKLAELPANAFAPRLPGDGWRVPFPRNEQFVGRGDDLAALHAALQQGAAVGIRPAGLTGLGGIGKTQLAVEYCYRYRDAYPGGVFWLNAAGEWLPAFAELGRFLDEEVDGKALDRQARAVAEYVTAHPDSLLVLDNVQDPALLRVPVTPDLTPAHLPCHVIFTTRRRDLGDSFTPVELSVLPEEPGLRLLLRYPTRQPALDPAHADHAAAVEVYDVLGGLPLALEIAGAHLGRLADRPISAYRDELLARGALAVVDDPHGKVRETDLGTRHAAAVEATLAEQWAALQSDDARLLLRVAGQFAEAEAIPAARLGLLAAISDRDGGFFGAPLALALDELHDAALVEKLAGDAIRLHPLVRDFAARRTPPAEVDAFRGACVANLLAAYRDFATLEDHCARRGVDALEADLLAALTFAAHDPNLQSPVSHLLRMLQRESHTLRGWDAAAEPYTFAQQWLKRAHMTGDVASYEQVVRTYLGRPFLTLLWLTAGSSQALERILVGHRSRVGAAAITPDGKRIVSASEDGTIKVWLLGTGIEERTLAVEPEWVRSLAVTPDGHFVVSASNNHGLTIRDIFTGEARTIVSQVRGTRCVSVTPDGRYVIAALADSTLRMWEIETGAECHTMIGHNSGVNAVSVTPNGKYAISASDDRTLRVWDLGSGLEKYTLRGHKSWVRGVTVTPDGRHVISASDDRTLKVWSLLTGLEVFTLRGHSNKVRGVAVTPDGRHVISASHDSTLKVWNLSTGLEVSTLTGHSSSVRTVVITPDGKYAVSSSYDDTLAIWRLSISSKPIKSTEPRLKVNEVVVTPNGEFVISCGNDRTIRMWRVATGDEVFAFRNHKSWVTSIAVTQDGRRLISGSRDCTLKVWDLATQEEVDTLYGHMAGVNTVAVTPDGQYAISGSSDRTMRVWRLANDIKEWMSITCDAAVRSLVITPDGNRVVSAQYDRTIRLFNVNTNTDMGILGRHNGWVNALAITSDTRSVVSASDDYTLKVWGLTTHVEGRSLIGHAQRVRAVATAPNMRCVSASDDHTLKVWDLSTGQELASIVLEAGVTCVALAPDGVTIVAGDAAGDIYCLRYQEPTADS